MKEIINLWQNHYSIMDISKKLRLTRNYVYTVLNKKLGHKMNRGNNDKKPNTLIR
jgi:Mor family transcriptional regulator